MVGICLFLFFYAIGIGSTPWAINSEIYPLHLIGTANSIAASSNWITNAVVSEVFKLVTEINLLAQILVYVGLWLFALLGWLFVYCMIPETAGKPIEQILEDILGKGYMRTDIADTEGDESRISIVSRVNIVKSTTKT